jgi:hypothetical protein
MRSRFGLSLLVALCATAAFIAWLDSCWMAWAYLLNGPAMPGMFGASARDIPVETAAETQERLRRDRAIRTELRWSTRVSRASATLSLLAAMALIWQSRMDRLRRQLAAALLGSISLGIFVLVLGTG